EINHTNWIRVLASDQGTANLLDGTRPRFSAFRLVKPLDKASPKLMLTCARGLTLTSARLQFVNNDASHTVFSDIQLASVMISSLAPGLPGSGEAGPTESFYLSFGSITWTCTAYDSFGFPAGG